MINLVSFLIVGVMAQADQCPSPLDLDVRMGDLLLEIRPGMQLSDFTQRFGKPAHNRFYPGEYGTREAIFEPRLSEGSREIGVGLVCVFQDDDTLRSCRVHTGPYHTQYVEREVVAELQIGDPIGAVFEKLCLPGSLQALESGAFLALYFFRSGGLYGAQALDLEFDRDGHLTEISRGH